MTSHYEVLGVARGASAGDIKKAFREKAKQLHPDVAGAAAAAAMRRLLAAYETLSSRERRAEYDRLLGRIARGEGGFDYREFLRARPDDPAAQARLIFFELLHLEDDAAIAVWEAGGGVAFPLRRCLDREDWMDCAYLLAEDLAGRGRYYEAFHLLVEVVREERRRPYFRHFMQDVETFLKELVRLRLRGSVDTAVYVECLEAMLTLGFSRRDEILWTRTIKHLRG